jgi:phosphoglycolate phosphatase
LTQPSTLVFDLDGTISDNSAGIVRSINHALSAFGYQVVAEDAAAQYIGPPLDSVFSRITRTDSPDRVRDLVLKFRERYSDVGYAENTMYDGIPHVLEYLTSHGVRMGICTGKRSDFAERILTMFGLRDHFAFVRGGDLGVRKEDLLRGLLAEHAIEPRSIMIGDRAVDITAARSNGLRSVGVLWGHGSRQEVDDAAPDRVVEAPHQLKTWCKAAVVAPARRW